MDINLYRNFFSEVSPSCTVPHYHIPCHNLISLESMVEILSNSRNREDNISIKNERLKQNFPFFNLFDYNSSISTILLNGSGMYDHVEEFLDKKLCWAKELKRLCPKNIKSGIQELKNCKDSTKIRGKELKCFLNHFNKDPEPNFSGSYNWLFTGGTLSSIQNDNDLFLYSTDTVNGKSVMNIVKSNNDYNTVVEKATYAPKMNHQILQVCSRKHNDGVFICLRQKKGLILVHSNDCLVTNTLWKKKIKQDKIIISMDMDFFCENILISDSRYDINLLSVERGIKLYGTKNKIKTTKDSWNQVMFGQMGLYFTNRESFYLLDHRVEGSKLSLKYTPSTVMSNCDNICSMLKSQSDSNFFYLGLTHSLIQVDVRTAKPVQIWSHLMKQPPQYGQTFSQESNELIILQSKLPDETVAIKTEFIPENNDCRFISKTMPFLMRSPKETLKLGHSNGIGLDPEVSSRFSFAITGIHTVKDARNDIHLFAQNSAGDVFKCKVGRKKDVETYSADENYLHNVINSVKEYDVHCQSLQLNNSRSLKHVSTGNVFQSLQNKSLNLGKVAKFECEWKYREKFDPESLLYHEDQISKSLLNIWNIAREETEDEMSISQAKVETWLRQF